MKTPSWLKELLMDSRITDICINGAQGVFTDQGNGLVLHEKTSQCLFEEDALRGWVLQAISEAGKTWDAKYPFVNATLPSGHRLHVAFPPLSSQGILVSLRRLARYGAREQNCHEPKGSDRWKDSPLFHHLVEATQKGDSIIVSGATGSGKTTLAGDLLEYVPSHERIIALEDTQELAPGHPHFLSLVSRPPNSDGFGEVTLRMLLKQTLRMRPDRIVLGECRGAEVMELLQALNTGHRGALATLHANSPRDALRRIELLCLLASGGAVSAIAIRELLSVGIQWIAQVHRVGPCRQITELWKIVGREEGTILMRQVVS